MENPRSALVGSFGAFAILFFLVVACQNKQPTTEPIEQVNANSLIKFYRDFASADETWKGRKVQIALDGLPLETYRVQDNQICVYSGMQNSEPCLICECAFCPPDNTKSIVVVGRVKGRVKDGKNRGNGIDWCVVVEGCSVLVR